MKDEVKIYDKLDKNIIKKFSISTISTKTYYFTLFYITKNIKIYHFLLFIDVPTFYTKTVFYITKILLNFIKLQKHY